MVSAWMAQHARYGCFHLNLYSFCAFRFGTNMSQISLEMHHTVCAPKTHWPCVCHCHWTLHVSLFLLQEGPRGYHCQCPPGFVGTHCEIQRNKCDSRPCQNGGRCHAVLDGFVCQCPPQFAGQLCEVSLVFHRSHWIGLFWIQWQVIRWW